MARLARWAALLAVLFFATATAHGGATFYGGVPIPITCRGSASVDDAPAYTAALARGLPVSVVPSARCYVKSQISLPSGTQLWLNGAAISASVPTNGGTAAVFAALPVQGTALVLAGTTTLGATTFTVTSITGLSVGGWIGLAHSVGEYVQTLQVAAITGSSNPYTVTVDRPLVFVFPAGNDGSGNPWVQVIPEVPVVGAQVHGGGATITAIAPSDRAIEASGLVDGLVEDVNIAGPFTTGIAFDVGTLRSTMRRVHVTGSSSVGVASESNEASRYEDVQVTASGSTGAASAFFLYNCHATTFRGLRATNNPGTGATLDAPGGGGGISASDGCAIEGSAFDSNGGAGVILTDGATRWRVSASSASRNGGDGVNIATTTMGAGPQAGTTFTDCTISSNASNGASLTNAADTTFTNCTMSSNGGASGGVLINATATNTQVRGGSLDSNAAWGVYALGDVTITGAALRNNVAGGVYGSGAPNILVSQAIIASTTVLSGWYGIRTGSTGVVHVTDTRISMPSGGAASAGLSTDSGTLDALAVVVTGGASTFGAYKYGGTMRFDGRSSLCASTCTAYGASTSSASATVVTY